MTTLIAFLSGHARVPQMQWRDAGGGVHKPPVHLSFR
jgi:hypothetical protein